MWRDVEVYSIVSVILYEQGKITNATRQHPLLDNTIHAKLINADTAESRVMLVLKEKGRQDSVVNVLHSVFQGKHREILLCFYFSECFVLKHENWTDAVSTYFKSRSQLGKIPFHHSFTITARPFGEVTHQIRANKCMYPLDISFFSISECIIFCSGCLFINSFVELHFIPSLSVSSLAYAAILSLQEDAMIFLLLDWMTLILMFGFPMQI